MPRDASAAPPATRINVRMLLCPIDRSMDGITGWATHRLERIGLARADSHLALQRPHQFRELPSQSRIHPCHLLHCRLHSLHLLVRCRCILLICVRAARRKAAGNGTDTVIATGTSTDSSTGTLTATATLQNRQHVSLSSRHPRVC
jgi:hypothetical protein